MLWYKYVISGHEIQLNSEAVNTFSLRNAFNLEAAREVFSVL